jgi:hypothetical protein
LELVDLQEQVLDPKHLQVLNQDGAMVEMAAQLLLVQLLHMAVAVEAVMEA